MARTISEIHGLNELGTVLNSAAKSKKFLEKIKFKDDDATKNDIATRTLKRTFDFIGLFGKILGWRFSYEWKSNRRHLFWIAFVAFTWSQFFYSQFKYFENGEYRRIFEVFPLYGTATSCSLRIKCFKRYHKEITAVHNFSFKITRQCGIHNAEKLENQQLQNLKVYRFIFWMEATAIFVYMFYPMKSFFWHHELLPLLPIEIMFTDQTQLSGFLTANVIMAVMGLYAVCVSLFIALNFYAIILNYSIQVQLIDVDIRQLDELWSSTKTTSLSERFFLLRNICQKCQDKDNYISEVKKIFDETIYLYFVAVYISQVICLYEVEVENWIPGYGIAYGLFVEMLLHCIFGTKVTIANEQLCFILTQSKWYTYDIHSQKIFLNLLNSCMNAKELWIGPMAPLSVITGIQILKSIYSYYTFLTEAM